MRKVLDVNMSRDDELRDFLEEGNQVVLLDEFVVECFKSGRPYQMLYRNLEILRQHPQLVVVPYSRGELVRRELESGLPTPSEEVVCHEYTETLRHLLSLNEEQLKDELVEHEPKAQGLIEDNNEFSEDYIRCLAAKAGQLDMREYHHDKEKLQADIAWVVIDVVKALLERDCKNRYEIDDFIQNKSMLFIVTYAHLWKVVQWRLNHGYQQSKKIPNDGFDLKYTALSCYFDGILTSEKWLSECRDSILSHYNR